MNRRCKGKDLRSGWARGGVFVFFLMGMFLVSVSLAQTPPGFPDFGNKIIGPALEQVEDPRQLPFSDFWEKEGELWAKIAEIIEALRLIDERLLPLEKRKEEVVSALRDLRRQDISRVKQAPRLRALEEITKSTKPLASQRTRLTVELSSLLVRWNLLQTQASHQFEREGAKFRQVVAADVVNRFVKGFQRADATAVSKLLLRGGQVNERWDQRGYKCHLTELFKTSQVQEFRIPDWTLREVNPYTIQVEGRYFLKIAKKPTGEEKPTPPKTKEDDLVFVIHEVSGEWLISNLTGAP